MPAFEKRWGRYARPVGTSWRAGETYARGRGRWTHLYRAVGKRGLTVDFLPGEHGDTAAAKRLFTGAVERRGGPERIALGGHPATDSAAAELRRGGALRPRTETRTSKYLNNLVGQGHGRARRRIHPTLGFKSSRNAAAAINGVELAREIRKGRFDTPAVIAGAGARVSRVWDVVPAG